MNNPVYDLKFSKRIADPVHGLIRLTELEAKVLAHPIFQRLRNITQLGMAKNVFPSATHNRFTHSLGVMTNTSLMYEAAYRNWKRNLLQNKEGAHIDSEWIFSSELLQTTRLAAMCHDLGHFPYSHNMEKAVQWLADEKIISKHFMHEDLSEVVIKHFFTDILGDHVDRMVDMIQGRMSDTSLLFPTSIISGAIDADRMDYLVRDALHCGVKHGEFDKERLLDTIIPYHTQAGGRDVDIAAFKARGIEAVEQFLLARHRMHQTVYLNPSVISFEGALNRFYYLRTANDPPWEMPDEYLDDPEKFVEFDEINFNKMLRDELKVHPGWLNNTILKRQSLVKYGPYYHTTKGEKTDEVFDLLQSVKDRVEIPQRDWREDEHWAFAEYKEQTLVRSIPKTVMRTGEGFDDVMRLKNVILLVNADGNLMDPTKIVGGGQHTFLPFIANHNYHRFMFYTSREHGDRLRKELEPLQEDFADLQSRKPDL
ncbi:MAG: HD domain-containing protein [Candidatus Heimdallarchaeota archaeon]|nr:HD domain-containing protein [Candidatus Heimdallarchaeota archaeon]